MTAVVESRSWMDSFKTMTRSTLVLSAFFVPLSTSITCVLFPLAFLLSLFAETPREKWRFMSRNPVAVLFLVLFFYYAISLFYTVAPIDDILWRMKKVWLLFFAAMLMSSFQEERWRHYAINAFLIAMLVTLCASYFKFYFHPAFMVKRFGFDGVFKDHIIQNFLMALAVFVCAYRFLNYSRYRWLYALLVLIATYNMFFINGGRSGYFIFAGLFFYFFVTQYGWKGLSYAIVLSAVLFGFLFSVSSVFRDRVLMIEENYHSYQQGHKDTSVGIRIVSCENAVALAEQRPIFGHGAGGFKAAYAALPKEHIEATGVLPVAFNTYLNVAVELGLVGVVLFIALLLFQWRASFQLGSELRFIIQALLLAYVVGSLGNAWLSDTTELHLYTLFSALAFAALPSDYRGFLKRKSANDASFSD